VVLITQHDTFCRPRVESSQLEEEQLSVLSVQGLLGADGALKLAFGVPRNDIERRGLTEGELQTEFPQSPDPMSICEGQEIEGTSALKLCAFSN